MNTFNILIKKAAADPFTLAGILTTAGHIGGKVVGKATDWTMDAIKTAPSIAFFTAAGTGLGLGHALARLTNPVVVANNSDKILESEALATEIAVTEKRLKALEKRRAALAKKKSGEQQYDRFV